MGEGKYADYFNHDTADVEVVIEVDHSIKNPARRQLQLQDTVCETAKPVLHGHAMVLMRYSPVWKAELERWQNTGESLRITMMVAEGEEAAAYRLVQCLYTETLPDIRTEVDLRMTLGILLLADQYQVKDALSLSADKLECLADLGTFSWELADSIMELPAAHLELRGISSLLPKIQEKILEHVDAKTSLPGTGLDLEVVMQNSTLEERLMALPLPKFASLLSDDRCRAASENTVAAVVKRRVDCSRRKRSRSGDGDPEHAQSPELDAQTLVDVIRVPDLSPLFAAAMGTWAKQLSAITSKENYALGRELGRLPADLRKNITEDLRLPRCWLKRRPPSTVTALEFDWQIPIAEVAESFDSGNWCLACSLEHFFAGLDWEVQLDARSVPDKGRTLSIFISCSYHLLTRGPRVGAATVEVTILGADGKSSLHRQLLYSNLAERAQGWLNFFDIPPMQKWDQSRMQKWTSSNGFLTVRVKVSDVL